MAQQVERRPVTATTAGSNPAVGVRSASEKRRVALTTEAASGGAIRRKLGLWCNGNISLLQSDDQGSSPCRSKRVRVAWNALHANRTDLGLSSNRTGHHPAKVETEVRVLLVPFVVSVR